MKNVFFLCAGRTASTSITNACAYISNFTSGHETRVGILGAEKLDYPDSHIEIDNRLVWFLAELEDKYGDEAYYVHLVRDHEAIAASYEERWGLKESIVKAYGHGILMKQSIAKEERNQICLDYVHSVDKKITLFLKDKTNCQIIRISDLKAGFKTFYEAIGAEGDLQKCLEELDNHANKNETSIFRKLLR